MGRLMPQSSHLQWKLSGTSMLVAVEPSRMRLCSRDGGTLHNVTMKYCFRPLSVATGAVHLNVMSLAYQICAPRSCQPEDVAAGVGPLHFVSSLKSKGYSATPLVAIVNSP